MADSDKVIYRVLEEYARNSAPDLGKVLPEHSLVDDIGLRSLNLAQIVVKLEMELGVDPFARLVPVTSVRTVGDLCDAYAKCFEPESNDDAAAPSPEETARADTRLAAMQQQRQMRGDR